ncbi:hypothetical protein NT6N_01020 [Oceaniferula spumae]|uniref:Aerotolerance regulator N-terminal domain-containing protein n=1 Tax=Oceaniferula spumae TaxID=2979115 RepID=A0AAT9FGG0_9BACT
MYQNTILGIIIGLILAALPCYLYLRALKRILRSERQFTKSPFLKNYSVHQANP